ncbi:lysophospholipid acyltransferase family protein [Actinacidiphila bryophytorum]|uniref:1-acyl-sn-glycerol-3-phosphate acyltransferases n=1 Tax=Actinacidiphila bryophytorum TaxID=1436133 RepID=A0A9W4H4B3_9ACTN|nr:lysophospholipid acyltransferase family protein [Actinacidiphila bryophytorum]CAG7649917.1 1-acyl-sn-glycerol-3-phosphate acyltransferases [Actinacidiphila bryophytorum]
MNGSAPVNGSPWAAVSPCSAACLAGGPPRVPLPVTLRRAAGFGAHLGGALAAGGRLGSGEQIRRRAAVLLADLGIRLDAPSGELAVPGAPTGTLVVANHISWLDVLALLAVQPATLLAKREVGSWPVVGTLVRRAGTRFIDRDGLRGLPGTVRELAALLRSGESVVVFPEGTTWCSVPGGPFRRATFQAALDAGAPVRPVTLAYTSLGAPTTLPAYVGEGTFAGSMRRVATARDLAVHVTAHPALDPAGHDRRSLAALAQAAVFRGPHERVAAHSGRQRLSPSGV